MRTKFGKDIKKICVDTDKVNITEYKPKSLSCEMDKRIEYNEKEHVYLYKGEKIKTSVTKLIEKFFSKFDGKKVATEILCRPVKFRGKYKDMNLCEIIKSWEDEGKSASEIGRKAHEKLEIFFNGNKVTNFNNAFKNAIKFDGYMLKKGYERCEPEKKLCYPEYDIAGMCDMIYYNKEKDIFALVDWKNCKEIKTKSKKKEMALDPISHLPDCNYSKYLLQLNMYAFIGNSDYYRDIFNNKIKKLYLVNIQNDKPQPEVFKLPIIQNDILNILEENKNKKIQK